MEPVLTAAVILRGIYGVLGVIATFKAHKLWAIRHYMRNQRKLPDDHEDVKAVTRMYKWWLVPVWVAVAILLITG